MQLCLYALLYSKCAYTPAGLSDTEVQRENICRKLLLQEHRGFCEEEVEEEEEGEEEKKGVKEGEESNAS